MDVEIRKIPGGISVDGLEFRSGKCGCTTVLPCCYSWSKVRQSSGKVLFTAKATAPDTVDVFSWGYTVRKGGVTVEVSFEDARGKKLFSGYYPPRVEDLIDRGWEVVSCTGERGDFCVWRCAACRSLYKEQEHACRFDDLPDDWTCPVCNTGKESFEQVA